MLRAAALACLFLVAACSVDRGQARLCQKVIEVIEGGGSRIEILSQEEIPGRPELSDHHVHLVYRVVGREAVSRGPVHWIACRFSGGSFSRGRLELAGVVTDRSGRLSEFEVFWLRHTIERLIAEAQRPSPSRSQEPAADFAGEQRGLLPKLLLYIAQQGLNASVLGAAYSLLALGYTLIYGLTRRINFAFGDIATLGAMTTAVAATVLLVIGGAGLWGIVLVFLLAALSTLASGWITGRAVFQPLIALPGHAVLIAAIGLSIVLQESGRLLQGARDLWLPVDLRPPWVLAEADGFTLVLGQRQLALLSLVGLLLWLLFLLVRRSRFGRLLRACADDWVAAELLGVNAARVLGATFALGGALAGLSGFVFMQYYGVANFFMGLLIGLKALTAAILGGIGSLPGAVLGSFIIAAVEVFWSAGFGAAYKDVAVFTLIPLVLLFRPQGLLGDGADDLLTGKSAIGAVR
jgi:branched-chain amino acid transport system permease protein